MTLIDMEVADLPEHKQKIYRDCIERGESPRLALMLASRSAPVMGGSDRTFNEGQRRAMNDDHVVCRERVVDIAKKAGINTHGKYYMGQLGRYGDPMAWVSSVDDVKEVAKRKNLSVDGLVKHKARETPPPPPVVLAEDIKNRLVKQELAHVAAERGPAKTELEARRRVSSATERVIHEQGSLRPRNALLPSSKNRAHQ